MAKSNRDVKFQIARYNRRLHRKDNDEIVHTRYPGANARFYAETD